MIQPFKSVVIAIVLSVGAVSVSASTEVEALSPELRSLLSKEMQALQDGMKSIFPAYISGNYPEIVKLANKMKNSYIMKQSITKDQEHELMTKLPKIFLRSDQKFHKYAGMLEHVAKEKNMELVGFYYSKLTESCVSCHGEFATHRFPGFTTTSPSEDHHH